jgi:Kelch motif
MRDSGQGGPVRFAILLASIAGMVVLGVKTTGGPDGASASHAAGHGTPGKIIAVVSRRRVPFVVRHQVKLPRAHGAAAIRAAGATYLMGGTRRSARGKAVPVASVLRIAGTGRPTRVAKLPLAVSGATAAVVGDRLYAIGGRLPNGKASDEVQEYDIATERSVVAVRLPKPIAHAAALTLDGYVYLLGGLTGGEPRASILRFDPWRDAVSPAGHLPVRASGGAAAAVRLRRGYLVGARVPGTSRLNFVITLRGPRVPGPRARASRRRPGRSRRPAWHSLGSSAAAPVHRRQGSAG